MGIARRGSRSPSKDAAVRIGVLSDTHGILESKILEAFQGVERILHAGDVGGAEILTELEALAPVTAVRGNCDGFPLAHRLREIETLELAGFRFLLIHEVGRPEKPTEIVLRQIRERRPDMIVFGHTHSPLDRVLEGVRFFNPGGSGPRRFGLPRTFARLELSRSGIAAELIGLDG